MTGSPFFPRDSQEYSPTTQFKSIYSSALSLLYSPTLPSIHDYWKNHRLTRWTFVGKVMSLLFNMLSRLGKTFLPRSKRLLISWLKSPSAVILEPKKVKYVTVSTVSPSISHEVMEPNVGQWLWRWERGIDVDKTLWCGEDMDSSVVFTLPP